MKLISENSLWYMKLVFWKTKLGGQIFYKITLKTASYGRYVNTLLYNSLKILQVPKSETWEKHYFPWHQIYTSITTETSEAGTSAIQVFFKYFPFWREKVKKNRYFIFSPKEMHFYLVLHTIGGHGNPSHFFAWNIFSRFFLSKLHFWPQD